MTPARYRYDPDVERAARLPDPGCQYCEICGKETVEDELDEEGLCEECR